MQRTPCSFSTQKSKKAIRSKTKPNPKDLAVKRDVFQKPARRPSRRARLQEATEAISYVEDVWDDVHFEPIVEAQGDSLVHAPEREHRAEYAYSPEEFPAVGSSTARTPAGNSAWPPASALARDFPLEIPCAGTKPPVVFPEGDSLSAAPGTPKAHDSSEDDVFAEVLEDPVVELSDVTNMPDEDFSHRPIDYFKTMPSFDCDLKLPDVTQPLPRPKSDSAELRTQYYKYRSLDSRSPEQVRWMKEYLSLQPAGVRNRELAALRWFDYVDYHALAVKLNVDPQKYRASFDDPMSLPLCDKAYFEIPLCNYPRGGAYYWAYCVKKQWPRPCHTCRSTPVFPRNGLEDYQVCHRCQASKPLELANSISQLFSLPVGTISPEAFFSLRSLIDSTAATFQAKVTSSLNSAAGVTERMIESALAKASNGMAKDIKAQVSKWLDQLVISPALKVAAYSALGLIVCTCIIQMARTLAIGLPVARAVLKIFAIAGCKLLDGVLSCLTKLSNYFKGDIDPVGESYVLPEGDEPLSAQLLCCLIMALGPATGGITPGSIGKALCGGRALLAGITICQSTFEGVVEGLPAQLSNYVCATFGLAFAGDNKQDRETLVEAMSVIEHLKRAPTDAYKAFTAERIIKVHRDLQAIILRATMKQKPIKPIFAQLSTKLDGFLVCAEKALGSQCVRVEPFCLYFQSEPGCGKSSMMPIFLAMVAGHVRESNRFHTWNRGGFQTGYSGQFALFIDELGAVNTKDEQEIFAKLLRYVSYAPENMDMAALEDKHLMFISRLIVQATNRDFFAADTGLKFPGAYHRRNVLVEVTLKEGWATETGVLNSAKITEQLRSGELSVREAALCPWMQFSLYTACIVKGVKTKIAITAGDKPGPIDLLTLVAYTRAQLQLKQEQHERRVEALKSVMEHVDERFKVGDRFKLKRDEREKLDVSNDPEVEKKLFAALGGEGIEIPEGETLSPADKVLKRVAENAEVRLLADSDNEDNEGDSEEDESDAPIEPPAEIPDPTELNAEVVSVEADHTDLDETWAPRSRGMMHSFVGALSTANAWSGLKSSANQLTLPGKPAAQKRRISRRRRAAMKELAENCANPGRKSCMSLSPSELVTLNERWSEGVGSTVDPAMTEDAIEEASMVGLCNKIMGVEWKPSPEKLSRRASSCVARLWQYVKEFWWSGISPMVRNFIMLISAGGLMLIVARGVFSEVSTHRRKVDSDPEMTFKYKPATKYSRTIQAPHGKAVRPNIAHRTSPQEGVAIPSDPCLDLVQKLHPTIQKLVEKNTGTISSVNGTSLHGFFAHTSKWNCPAHFFYNKGFAKQGEEFTIECDGVSHLFRFDIANLTLLHDGVTEGSYVDWCCYDTGKSFNHKKNIVKYFLPENRMADAWRGETVLCGYNKAIDVGPFMSGQIKLNPYFTNSKGEGCCASSRFEYKHVTNKGDCGMLLAKVTPNDPVCLCGGHIASVNTGIMRSVSLKLTRELLELLNGDACDIEVMDLAPIDGLIPFNEPSINVPSGRQAIYKIPRNMKRVDSGKTCIRRSVIADADFLAPISSGYAPAVLGNPSDPRCMGARAGAIKALRKSKHADKGRPSPIMPKAKELTREFARQFLPSGSAKPLSWDECLNGRDGSTPYPRNSSPGWPAKLDLDEAGKHDFVKFDEEKLKWHLTDEFERRMNNIDAHIRKGGHVQCVFEIITKDEVLPNKKNDKRDTRTITIVPFELNLLYKKYFGPLAISLIRAANSGNSPWLNGINPFSSAWDKYIKKHFSIGKFSFDGDYEGFEYQHIPDGFDGYAERANDFEELDTSGNIDPSAKTARSVLMFLCIHTLLLIDDVIHPSDSDFASGLWITADFNTFASWFYVVCAFFTMALDNLVEILSSKAFRHLDAVTEIHGVMQIRNSFDVEDFLLTLAKQNLWVSSNGDDHTVTRSPEVGGWFNGKLLHSFFRENGRAYTPAEKASEFGDDRPITECGFLSGITITHVFPLVNDEKYYYCLKRDNAMKQLVFVTEASGERGLAQNIDSCLRSVWASGHDSFNHLRRDILGACQEIGYDVQPITFDTELRRRQRYEASPEAGAVETTPAGWVSTLWSQSGRGLSNARTLGGARRLVASALFMLQSGTTKPMLVPLGSLRKGHAITFADMRTVYSRASALYNTPFSENWLDDAGITSNGSQFYVLNSSGYYIAGDGNNRTAAMILAARWLNLDLNSLISVPVVTNSRADLTQLVDNEPKASCEVCSLDGCDVCYRLRPPDAIRSIRVEMEEAEQLAPLSLDDPTPEIDPTPGGLGVPPNTMEVVKSDVMDVLKRSGFCCSISPLAGSQSASVPVLGLMAGVLTAPPPYNWIRPWPHAWFMSMYALWWGGARIVTVLPERHRILGSASALQPAEINACASGDHCGLLPQEVTGSQSGFTSVQVPYLSIYNAVRVPLDETEAFYNTSISGFVNPHVVDGTEYGDMYIAAADDSQLALLWQVPVLKVNRRTQPVAQFIVIPESSTGKGMTFDDASPTVMPTVKRMPSAKPPESMDDTNFSFPDMLQRVQRQPSLIWNAGSAKDTVIAQYVCPHDLFIGAAANAVKSFNYFSADVVFRFNIHSNPMQAGLAIAHWVPLRDSQSILDQHRISLPNKTLNPHVYLRAGSNSVVELRIPYAHPKPMLDPNLNNEIPMGTLLISVVNPVNTGVDSDFNVQISVFTRFENVNLLVVRPVVLAEGGSLSSNVQSVLKKTVDVASAASEFAGKVLDKPNVGMNPVHIVRKQLPYFSNSVNVDHMQVMALDPAQTVNEKMGNAGTTINETKIDYLTSKWTMYGTFNIPAAIASGDLIAQGLICPVQLAHQGIQDQFVSESLLGYVSLLHTYWHGDIELKFEFIGTRFHTARFDFVTHYGGTAENTSLLQATQQNMVSYEYSYDNPTLTVVLPWRAPTNSLLVPPHTDAIPRVHTGGEWSLRCDTPLVFPDTVGDSIECNVSIRGGKGFTLHGIYGNSLDYTPVPVGPAPT